MAVPAFKGLKASKIKLSLIFSNPSVPKCPEQARTKLTASPQVTLPGASSLVHLCLSCI